MITYTVNAETLPVAPVNLTAVIDDEQDVTIRLNGINVAFFHKDGTLNLFDIEDHDQAELRAAGVQISTTGYIKMTCY